MGGGERAVLNGVERDFLKQVFVCLLSGKGSCLHTGPDQHGLVMYSADGPHHFAIERLLERFGASEEFADLVANAYLDRFDARPTGLFKEWEAVSYAERIALRFPLSREVQERFIHAVARVGWHGRLEGLARLVCGRNPTVQEVADLFSDYINGASYSTSTDTILSDYARKYMPAEEARMQIKRIEQRNRKAAISLDF